MVLGGVGLATTFGGTIRLSGEKEYQAALQNIANKLKLTDSEMKKLNEQSKNITNSTEFLTKKGELLSKQYQVQESKVKVYESALGKATEEEKKAGKNVDELKEKLNLATKRMEEMKQSSSTTAEELSQQQKEIEDLSKHLNKAETYYLKTSNTTMRWKASLNSAEVELLKVKREIEDNNNALEKAGEEFNKTSSATEEFENALQTVENQSKLTDSEIKKLDEQLKSNKDSIELLTKKGELLSKQYQVQESKVKVYESALGKATEEEKKAGKNVDELKEKLNLATKRMEEMKQSSSTTAEELSQQQREVQKLSKQLDEAEEYYKETTNSTVKWQIALNSVEADLSKVERKIRDNNYELEKSEKEMDETSIATNDYAKSIKSAGEETLSFGTILKANLVSSAIVASIGKLTEGIKDFSMYTVQTGMEFEQQMSRVKATLGATEEEFVKLNELAIDLGSSTAFSSMEVAEGMENLASAGFSTSEIMEAMSGMLDLAASSGEDLASSADIAASTLRGFGLEADQAGHVADVLAKNAADTNAAVKDTGEAMKYIAPVAHTAGLSLEEVAASIGIMADSGIQGSQAGTTLRGALSRLAKPTEKMLQVMDELGLSFYDSNGEMKSLSEMTEMLKTNMSGLTDEQQQNALVTLFGQEALSGMTVLMEAGSEKISTLTKAYENCDGAAAEMAETMMDNLAGAVEEAGGAFETVGLTIYDKFETPLKEAVEAGTRGLNQLNYELTNGELGESVDRLAEDLGKAAEAAIDFGMDALPVVIDGLDWMLNHGSEIASSIVGIGVAVEGLKIAEAVTSVTTEWKKYKAANEGATVAQWALNTAMSANPVGILAAGVAGLVAAFAVYETTQSRISEETMQVLDDAQEALLKSESINQEVEENIAKRRENIESIESEYGAIQNLSDRLYDLAEKETISNGEKEEMNALVAELNKALPDLGLAIDEETGKLNKNREETDALTASKIGYYKAQAYQESLTDIAKQQIDLEKNLKEIQEERKKVDEDLRKAEENYSKSLADTTKITKITATELGIAGEARRQYSEEVDELKAAQENLNKQEAETKELIKQTNQEYDEAIKYITSYNSSVSENSSEIQQNAGETIQWGEQTKQVSKENKEAWNELIGKYEDTLESARDSIRGQLGLFDEYKEAQKVTAAEMIKGLESQITASKNWKTNIEELHGHVSETVLSQLESMGLSSASYVQALVDSLRAGGDGAGTELDRINQLFSEKINMEESIAEITADAQGGFSAFFNSVDEITVKGANEVGQKMGEGFESGMSSSIVHANSKAAELYSVTIEDAKNRFSLSAPEVGKAFIDGQISGLQLNAPALNSAAVTGVSSAIDSANIVAARGNESGTNIVNSAVAAVQANSPTLSNAATAGVGAAVDSANNVASRGSETGAIVVQNQVNAYNGSKQAFIDTTATGTNEAINNSNAVASRFSIVGQTGASAAQSGWNLSFPGTKSTIASNLDVMLSESQTKMQQMNQAGATGGINLKSGWQSQYNNNINAIRATGLAMLNAAQQIAGNMTQKGSAIGLNQAAGYRAQDGTLQTVVRNSSQGMLNIAQSYSNRFPGIGSSYANGISSGWDGVWGGIVNKVTGGLNYLHQKALEALQINSPSKLSTEAGMFYGKGYEVGGVKAIRVANEEITKELKKGVFATQEVIENNSFEPLQMPVAISLDSSQIQRMEFVKELIKSNLIEFNDATYKVQNEVKYTESEQIFSRLETALKDFSSKQPEYVVVLEDGTLVGKMMPKISKELNNSSFKSFIIKTAKEGISNNIISSNRARGRSYV